ncbi:MAG: hypothetical protein ACO20V_12840, partial [Alphaproteobacteria bacterium]
ANHRNRVFLTVNEASSRATSQGTKKIINLLMNDQTLLSEAKQSNALTIPLFKKINCLKKISFV